MSKLQKQEKTQGKKWWVYKYKKNVAEPGRSTDEHGESPNKRQKTQTDHLPSPAKMANQNNQANRASDVDMETDGVLNDQPANSGGGSNNSGGMAGLRGTVQFPGGARLPKNISLGNYNKNYKFRIKSEYVEYSRGTGTDNNSYIIVRFPYHDIPVDRLGFFLSQEEINKLKHECVRATVKEVQVEIWCRQVQLPFETASTTSTVVNNNVGYFVGLIDPEVQKVRRGTYSDLKDNFINQACFGASLDTLPVTSTYTSNNLGTLSAEVVVRNLDLRFQYGCRQRGFSQFNNNFVYKEPIFPLERYVMKRWNGSFNEGLFHTYHYKPTDGVWHIYNGSNGDNPGTDFFGNDFFLNENQAIFGAGAINQVKYPVTAGFANVTTTSTEVGKVYMLPQSQHNMADHVIPIEWDGSKAQPPLIIGLDPLITGDIGNNQGKLVDAQMIIEVRTHLIMEEQRFTDYQYRYGGNRTQPDMMHPIYRSARATQNNFDYVTGSTQGLQKGRFITSHYNSRTSGPEPVDIKEAEKTEDFEEKDLEAHIKKNLQENKYGSFYGVEKVLTRAQRVKIKEEEKAKRAADRVRRNLFPTVEKLKLDNEKNMENEPISD